VVNVITSNPLNASVVSKFVPDATTGIHRVAQAWNPISGVKYTQQVLLKSAGVRCVYINLDANAGARLCVDLQTGQFVTGGISSELCSVVSIGDGWYLCTITGTGTSQTGNNTWFQANESLSAFDDSWYVGSGSNGFYLIAADLRTGTIVNKYQRVNTATDYDTDERYFPKYLRFDGVDDYLNLPYMGLYANGSASVVAGINGHQFGEAYNGRIICESLVSANAPTYAPLIQIYRANTTNAYMANDAATTFVDTGLLLAQNIVSSISIIDSGASIKSYQNSSQKAASTYTRSGTVTLDSTTIGKGINNGSAEIWKGDLYGLIVTKSALTDSQRVACERYAASKAGVIL
jgi:hypothetical protein